MHGFVRNLITEWRRLGLPLEGETVVVAVSGGADSVSLLLAMYELKQREKLRLRLVAAHFNHQLRGAESDADEEFVRQLTKERGIEFAAGRGDVHADGNLEQNARRARYAFLESIGRNLHAFAVLTGHTMNDQAETFLMNLIRGSGIEGLKGMRVLRTFDFEDRDPNALPGMAEDGSAKMQVARPMLTWAKRGDTEQYCRDLGVEYRYDTMNEDTAFKRVRIRKILLPLLEDMNPNIVQTIANTAELMQHQPGVSVVLDGSKSDELLLRDLKALSQPELYNYLRGWLGEHRGNMRQLELKHIKAIERLVFSEKSGKTAELPDGAEVIKSGGKLTFKKNEVEN